MEPFPILIPSRGRPECPTAALLAESGLDFRLLVEPAQADAYAARWGRARLEILPADGRGLPSARNAALDLARAPGRAWTWMLDDDVRRFARADSGRCVVVPARDALLGAQAEFAGRPDVALAALEYWQFAWSCRGRPKLNSYCDVAVCLHAGRTRALRFREGVTVKLDRDFALQVLASGHATLRSTLWAFDCPKNGSNPGGLADAYATPGLEEAASRRMCELWGPDICTFHRKPDGRPDVKIHWRHFRPRPAPA